MQLLSSTSNEKLKLIMELKKKATKRSEKNLCVIEGYYELKVAIESNIKIESIYILNTNNDDIKKVELLNSNSDIYLCTSQVMDKITTRDNYIVALGHISKTTIETLELPQNPNILILENIEKPGNLGSIFRIADAAKVDLIICTEMQTDLFNSNVIRNSLGCVFSNKIIYLKNIEALNFINSLKIPIYSTYLHTTNNFFDIDLTTSSAIVFGSENNGISEFWIKNSTKLFKIPMYGKIDSMNVSNSVSVVVYELIRQRLFA